MNKFQRTELHLHTKRSDDASIIGVNDALKYAIQNEYKAIAFTNLNNVQDFLCIQKISERYRDHNINI